MLTRKSNFQKQQNGISEPLRNQTTTVPNSQINHRRSEKMDGE